MKAGETVQSIVSIPEVAVVLCAGSMEGRLGAGTAADLAIVAQLDRLVDNVGVPALPGVVNHPDVVNGLSLLVKVLAARWISSCIESVHNIHQVVVNDCAKLIRDNNCDLAV